MQKTLLKTLDTLLYLLVVPFGILYVYPHFLLGVEKRLGIELPLFVTLEYVGVLLLFLGGILALSCGIVMRMSVQGSINPFTKPVDLVRTGPFAVVRHPMMWAGKFVLIGYVLIYSSPILLLWLAAWSRLAVIYIARYEEPYLLKMFGDSYKDYCESTPRWWPRWKKTTRRS